MSIPMGGERETGDRTDRRHPRISVCAPTGMSLMRPDVVPSVRGERKHERADVALELDCPVCGRATPTTLLAIRTKQPIRCPAGHPLRLHDCAGLPQVIDFVLDLDLVARSCPP
jgi:hypothetical protein